MRNFHSFLHISSRIFRRSDDFKANFRENSCVVVAHIVLLASLLTRVLLLASLNFFWHPCCGSPFCCWRCDDPIVSAAVGLPPCCCRLHCFCKHPCFSWSPYCVGGPGVAFNPAVACIPAVVSGHDIAAGLSDYGYRTVIYFCYRTIGISYWRIQETIDYWIWDQGLNLSDYRISDSEKTISCPPLECWSGISAYIVYICHPPKPGIILILA